MNNKTAYDILGVGRFTTKAEVRRKYLELCKKHHPDVAQKVDGVDIRDIVTAYEYLTDKNSNRTAPSSSVRWEQKNTRKIDTQLWTRRSTLIGLGIMGFTVLYLTYDRPSEVKRILPHERLRSARINGDMDKSRDQHKTEETSSIPPWQVAGMSYREWRKG